MFVVKSHLGWGSMALKTRLRFQLARKAWLNAARKRVEQRREKLSPKWFARARYKWWRIVLLGRIRTTYGILCWLGSSKVWKEFDDRLQSREFDPSMVGIGRTVKWLIRPWIVWSCRKRPLSVILSRKRLKLWHRSNDWNWDFSGLLDDQLSKFLEEKKSKHLTNLAD